jgi:homoserine O-acetyltransferase/O-succinyltransferase
MTVWPNQQEGVHLIRDFRFASGETLAELRLHYITLGTPRRNAAGAIVNAVLLLHNTTGSAKDWLSPELGGELFGAGQPLDASQYYIILPDAIGFGGSSKPSDGLRAAFPHYRYSDIVEAEHSLVTEGLGVAHLRLVLGLSMGGMLTWLFAGTHPDFMDALVPIASQPGPMSGRNWIQRRVSIEAIRNDPEWNGGNYTSNPSRYVYTAPFSALMVHSVVRLQEMAPTRAAADALYERFVERARQGDANNRLYQVEASADYDPTEGLARAKAPLLAINFADDELNPPELGVLEAAVGRMPKARCVIVPAGPQSVGHQTALRAAQWRAHLAGFLAELPPPAVN